MGSRQGKADGGIEVTSPSARYGGQSPSEIIGECSRKLAMLSNFSSSRSAAVLAKDDCQ